MKILLIGNLSDRRCGFQNFSVQFDRALRNAGHSVTCFDGTYSQVYARIQDGLGNGAFLPYDAATYDVIQVVWHPLTLNHYSGAVWPTGGPVISLWNGGPSDSYCPFDQWMTQRWSAFDRDNHRPGWYPIVDWLDDLPEPDPHVFTVGVTGVREEGFAEIAAVCEARGYAYNRGEPNSWIPLDDEIRRLARSTVNVCWYGPHHQDRSGGVMTSLATRRPQVVTNVPMCWHLSGQQDLYWDEGRSLDQVLADLHARLTSGEPLQLPALTFQRFRWARMIDVFEEGWTDAAV